MDDDLVRLANLRQERGDAAGALALLDESAAALGPSPYALNTPIDRAVDMLELDRVAEALAEIDATMAGSAIARDAGLGRGGEEVPRKRASVRMDQGECAPSARPPRRVGVGRGSPDPRRSSRAIRGW